MVKRRTQTVSGAGDDDNGTETDDYATGPSETTEAKASGITDMSEHDEELSDDTIVPRSRALQGDTPNTSTSSRFDKATGAECLRSTRIQKKRGNRRTNLPARMSRQTSPVVTNETDNIGLYNTIKTAIQEMTSQVILSIQTAFGRANNPGPLSNGGNHEIPISSTNSKTKTSNRRLPQSRSLETGSVNQAQKKSLQTFPVVQELQVK